MNRRNFLKFSGSLTAQSAFASAAIQSLWLVSAHGQAVSLSTLHSALKPQDGQILVPNDSDFARYQMAFNKRTLKVPLVRVLCATPAAVATCVQWAKSNRVPLAMRSGGHSFEGLSQTTGLAIDTRPMNALAVSEELDSFTSGAGVQLGQAYQYLAQKNLTIPAGSCPPVGITGHTLGGGYGLVARPFGLACDSLVSAQVVTADGVIRNCSAQENPDLFWALRGGGPGSFGVVTQLSYRPHEVQSVAVYSIGWDLDAQATTQLMQTWQHWAPFAPREITSLMKVSRGQNGLYNIRAIGQTIGSEHQLQMELAGLTAVSKATVNIQTLSYFGAVTHFSGGFDPEYTYMKGKSDYIKQVMTADALTQFLKLLPSGIAVIFDSYGGAIGDLKDDDTAFAHRSGVLSSLQYYTEWSSPDQTEGRLAIMRGFYDAMRPYMSGAAYFNYCDLDLKNYATSYWGGNLPRLMQIKAKYDPQNLFRHAQSVPLKV